MSAGRSNIAAIDGDRAAFAFVAAADACAIISAGRGDLSTVDRNHAAAGFITAADTGVVCFAVGNELAGAVFLREDIDTIDDAVLVGIADQSLVTGQLCAVAEQEIDVVAQSDKVLERYVVGNDIPAVSRPKGVLSVGSQNGIVINRFRGLLYLFRFRVP